MPDSGSLSSARSKTSRAGTRFANALQWAVVGDSATASTFAIGLGAVLAAVSAVWVGTTVGAETLADDVLGVRSGQFPATSVLAASGGLVVLGAVSAFAAAGFVPTALLVGGPIFGAGVTRVGNEYVLAGSTYTVPLSEAALDAAGAVLVVGVPLAALGFAIGITARKTVGLGVSALE